MHLRYASAGALLSILCILSPGCTGDSGNRAQPSAFTDTVTVLAYNVENLFDLVKNGSEFPDYIPGTHNWNEETLAKKLDNASSVITAAKADILVLSEIENGASARLLQKELFRKKQNFGYLAFSDTPNPSSTVEVLLSRYPIIFHQGIGIPKMDDRYTRNILEADIALGSHTLKLFCVHWPSKRFPESYRCSAAQVLIDRISQLPPRTDYIIAGDFNSNHNEAETFFTEGLDNTNGVSALNHILKTVKSLPGEYLDFVTEAEIVRSSDTLYHYNLWLETPSYKRFSYIYLGHRNTIDNMILPHALFDGSGISYLDNSFGVFTWNGRLLVNGQPYRWKTVRTSNGMIHAGEGFSDHLPIRARFVARPFTCTDSLRDTPARSVNHCVNGFETGVEGWAPYNGFFKVNIDSTAAASGLHSLSIRGIYKRGVSAAHLRIPLNKPGQSCKTLSTVKAVTLSLKGNGRFAFRSHYDDSSWVCYTGDNFTKAIRSTRFSDFNSQSWQSIKLVPPPAPADARAFELQIRVAKNVPLKLWIDDIRIE